MPNQWIVPGGWAMPPQELTQIFDGNSCFIDVNRQMSKIIIDGQLIEDWDRKLALLLFAGNSQPCYLAGWSTGAIIAVALARIIKPKALILFAPTHSFCRHESFLQGTRPSVLRSMINELECKKETVLQQFFTICSIDI